ncbi:putative bifunctional diguanylate cyclase/phosphodiesterase [Undibacterium curvum]|uniref:putative bifunctional diguanylate cyclase/phosphodiesterase n=1 Tax=Undibacterium curvum TaxID=2762294 RepID=UPI003D09E496
MHLHGSIRYVRTCSMTSPSVEELTVAITLSDVVLVLPDEELEAGINRATTGLFPDSLVQFVWGRSDISAVHEDKYVCSPVTPECFFLLSARYGQYSESDLKKLHVLTALTARLLATRKELLEQKNKWHSCQLLHNQILDHLHDSVITMDLAGFILSWNRGAENLFGYSAQEALGKNVIFLYDNEDQEDELHDDHFLKYGGSTMEVRRKKKSGEVFWASLTLNTLKDKNGTPIALVGYLSDITQRKQTEQQLNHLAYFDPLTNLPNRIFFNKLVDQRLQIAQRKQQRCAILFVDLNRFKAINDTLGHEIGNALLQQVAQRFRQVLREEDLVARLGSDEFAIAIADIASQTHVGLVVEKLLASLDEQFQIGRIDLSIGASVGIAMFPDDGSNSDLLLQRADIAMYKVKRDATAFSGDYAYYNQQMNAHVADRLYLETSLRKALEQQQFFLLYQPKFATNSGQFVSVEALVRWQHPERGMISPAEFIHIAEDAGLISELGNWVLHSACRQARIWQNSGVSPFLIGVNVSAREFTDALPGKVATALQVYGISPQWLQLEITESMLMQGADEVIWIMERLVALGVGLALDDFGTGYSSLSYLKRFPISTLKIDQSFVRGIPSDTNDCAIASAIIVMAHQLNLEVVAEGVETTEQFEFLGEAGCNQVQGYLLSKPVSAEKIANLYLGK